MPSTFFGLTIASSALNAFQISVNATANNMSNVNTKGYSRQKANLDMTDALRVNAKYGSIGTGVEVSSIKQVRDFYYDVKYWNSNSNLGLYDTKLYYAKQVEDYVLDDDATKGFNTILDEMFNALDTLKTQSGSRDARQQFISKALNMVNFFTGISAGLGKIQDNCNQEISTQVHKINSIGQKIAILNKEINVIELQGGYANELRDQRASLVDELSSMVSVECVETEIMNSNYPDMYLGGTDYVVKINGQVLVNGFNCNELEVVAREYKVNQSDNDGLYDVRWVETGNPLAVTGDVSSGSLKALFEMRDGNNKENFSGTVSDVTAYNGRVQLVIKGASITDVKAMTMNNEGIINVDGKELEYTGFSYDADTQTYTFDLKEYVNALDRSRLKGKSAEIGSSIDAMGIPYYEAQMNNFLRSFAEAFNNMHISGVDADGNDAGAFFVAVNPFNGIEYDFTDYKEDGTMSTKSDCYYRLTAENFNVANAIVHDPMLMAVVGKEAYGQDDVDKYELVERMLTLKSDVILFRGGGADDFLKCLITDNSVDTQKFQKFFDNYTNLTGTIEMRRMSISGVDEDEEGMDLLKFQNAYNLASKTVQVLTEMYDRLILETGV